MVYTISTCERLSVDRKHAFTGIYEINDQEWQQILILVFACEAERGVKGAGNISVLFLTIEVR